MQEELARALRDAAERFGTPLYVYDVDRMTHDAQALRDAFGPPWIVLYSLKANALRPLVCRLPALGYGANAVSLGELIAAREAGFEPSLTALEGIGKTERELREVIRRFQVGTPPLWVSLESSDEAAALAALAGNGPGGRGRIDVLLRVNPEVSPETHAGLAVGARGSKFGMLEREIDDVVQAGGGIDGPLRWRGVHVHTGSQLRSVTAWRSALASALRIRARLARRLPDMDTVDAGSGFPVLDEPGVPTPGDFAAVAAAELQRAEPPARLAVEPGRAVVARSGWLVGRVLHVRARDPRQVVLDAGMTELIRPALYGARHPMAALTSRGVGCTDSAGEEMTDADVHGPVCESTDYLGTHRLPALVRGDLVAIGQVGAYGASMASTYNARPLPRAVLWQDGDLHLADE